MADRRSFWAWCMESEEPTDAERAELATRLSERYGVPLTPRPVPRAEDAELRPPRDHCPAGARSLVLDVDLRAGLPRLRRPLHRPDPGVQPRVPQPARRRRPPPRRGRAGGHARLVPRRRSHGHPLRRRVVGGLGGQPARGLRQLGHDRPRPPRPGARDRRHLPGRPHPGRRARPRARGPAAAPRLHAAPLPPVVPLLVARRLDRHPLGRPLRHEPHPHRRLRRVGPDAHPAGLVGVAPAARLRRRPVTRPHGDRQRGHPRHHHRGLDAHPGAGRPSGPRPASRSTAGRPATRRSARSCRPSCGRPTAASSTRPRPAAPPGSTASSRW